MRTLPPFLLLIAFLAQALVGGPFAAAGSPVPGSPNPPSVRNRHCGDDCTCGHACCAARPANPAPQREPAVPLRSTSSAKDFFLPPPPVAATWLAALPVSDLHPSPVLSAAASGPAQPLFLLGCALLI